MENPIFAKTVSTRSMKIGERYLVNHNKLLRRVEGADGVKTGFTKAAGRILVSSAQRQGRRIVAVTIDAPDDWNDHAALLEAGFSRYSVRKLVSEGDVADTVEVLGGESQLVERLAAEDFFYALAPDEKPELAMSGPGFVYAPAVEGAEAGFAYVLIGGKTIGKIPLVYGQTVEQSQTEEKTIWQKLAAHIS
jgi:D-alanyl-D-alanine carboxypeptidase